MEMILENILRNFIFKKKPELWEKSEIHTIYEMRGQKEFLPSQLTT